MIQHPQSWEYTQTKLEFEKTHASYVPSSTIRNSQDMETMWTDEWIKKMWHIYMLWNISHKKNEIMPFAAT